MNVIRPISNFMWATMRKLVLECIFVLFASTTVFAWEVPSKVHDLIIGPYVAQNNASFKKVSVKAGEECLIYSDGTSAEIMEDRGEEVLVKLNASLVFKVNYEDKKGARPTINLYKDYLRRDNDLCPRGTVVLFDKTELRELHDIKSLHVEDYFRADRVAAIAAERKSIGVPEQVKDLVLGYYTAQNSARDFKNFINAGESCAVIAKGSDLHVASLSADGMMSVRYHSNKMFMYNDAEGVSQKVNNYTVFKKHNTDICPDGTILSIPFAVLNEWNESKKVNLGYLKNRGHVGNQFANK